MKIKTNSKKVISGDTFYAIKGYQTDGHDYIEEAILKGATTIYAEYGEYSKDVIIVPDTSKQLLIDLNNTYSYIFDELKLIAVTGTNGKTTTAYLIYQALNNLNIKASYMGTIGFHIDDSVEVLNNTTPDIVSIYEMMVSSFKAGCKYMCMEVSSHALKLGRVEELDFEYAIYTNLSKDHLDFHNNMSEYANSKAKLFKQLSQSGCAIINIDDEYSCNMLLSSNNNLTYGIDKTSDYCISDYECNNKVSEYNLLIDREKKLVKTSLLGSYNAYNLTSVIILLRLLKVDTDTILELITKLTSPSGRMSKIEYDTNLVIVDYAHTPDAVEKIIKAVREFSKNKIYSIIGCGGNRDKSKRLPMANISTSLSDYVIFTNDNPRLEDEVEIIKDMTEDLKNYNYEIEYNRKEAIYKGIDLLEDEDILLILGKGHENYQIIGNNKYFHDDKLEAEKYIKRKK